jgi:hypothetical protein
MIKERKLTLEGAKELINAKTHAFIYYPFYIPFPKTPKMKGYESLAFIFVLRKQSQYRNLCTCFTFINDDDFTSFFYIQQSVINLTLPSTVV